MEGQGNLLKVFAHLRHLGLFNQGSAKAILEPKSLQFFLRLNPNIKEQNSHKNSQQSLISLGDIFCAIGDLYLRGKMFLYIIINQLKLAEYENTIRGTQCI